MQIRSISSLLVFALSLTLGASPAARAESAGQKYLLALSKGDHTIAIINPADLKVIAKVPVGPDPHEVVASADGKTAYVSNTGSGKFHEINVIDLDGKKALPNIDTGALIGPHGLDFADGRLWFTAEGAKAVASYDPAKAQIDLILGTGQDRTHMIRVNPDGKLIFTTNVDAGTVTIMDNVLVPPTMPPTGVLPPGAQPKMAWLETVIPVGKGSEGFDISPDGHTLWTAAAADGTIAVIDVVSKKLVATIDARVPGANRLKFTPDGKHVLVSSLKSGDLVVFDVEGRKEIKRLNIGKGGSGILMDADAKRAFIACTPDDYVVVFDLDKLEVLSHLDVGAHPDGLNWASVAAK